MRKLLLCLQCLVLAFIPNVMNAEPRDSVSFTTSQAIDTYGALLRNLSLYYVDSVSTQQLVQRSIDQLLESLDPYTSYIPKEKSDDFKYLISGEYGGIGAVVAQHYLPEDTTNKTFNVVISDPYEGMPAQKMDLKAGDIITAVDGKSVKGKSVNEVSELLRGTPETFVKVTVQRSDKEITKKILREKIQINPVSYYGFLNDSIAYILLSQFTDKAADAVKGALINLQNQKRIAALILDLRGNPGGLLDQAVEIANLFLPQNKEVLSMKGKYSQWDQTLKTTEQPILPNLPLAVLINSSSASASEIVSGALQDHDRAVIIGSRSYGKGLVQSTRNMPYGAHIKLTTAKYYIPSGRCIQAIDYTHRNEDGSVGKVPDSLMKEFKTDNGRTVKDGGGIMPDIEVKNEQKLDISYYLFTKNIIFDYATLYAQRHKSIPQPEAFTIDSATWNDFKDYTIRQRHFTYHLASAEYMDRLAEVMQWEGYDERSKKEFDALKEKLKVDVATDMEHFRTPITQLLEEEISKRYYLQKGGIRKSISFDPVVTKAIETLSDKNAYEKLLTPTEED
ncbi:MAG: S41 family peptidase [Paludibacteraceae bacterium]|jgi:carboxyl-terminal processing protease|nr:S41 family peptidase [Paludibacteraceae bacterium]